MSVEEEVERLASELLELRTQMAELLEYERPRASYFAPALVAGIWTPSFTGTTTAGVFTYGTRAGIYRVLDDLVLFTADIVISAIPTPPAGSMTITGLPFAAASGADKTGCVILGKIHNFKYTAAAKALTARVGNGTATIVLTESFDNAVSVAVPAANFTNAACELILSGFYPIP